jgi:hypothetical protein
LERNPPTTIHGILLAEFIGALRNKFPNYCGLQFEVETL